MTDAEIREWMNKVDRQMEMVLRQQDEDRVWRMGWGTPSGITDTLAGMEQRIDKRFSDVNERMNATAERVATLAQHVEIVEQKLRVNGGERVTDAGGPRVEILG